MRNDQMTKKVINKTKDGRHIDIFMIFCMVIIIAILSLGSLILKDREISYNEDRILTQAPEFDLSGLLNGSYEEQMERYLSDQIIGRGNWIKISSTLATSIGIRDVNGVYVFEDGRLAERIMQADFDYERYTSNLMEIASSGERLGVNNKDIKLMLVPTGAYSYRDKYDISTSFDEEMALNDAGLVLNDMYIDLQDILKQGSDGTGGSSDKYYKTDKHLNYTGSELTASAYRESVGLRQNSHSPEILTRDFMGSLYSEVLLSDRVRDTIEVPLDTLERKVRVSIDGEEFSSIYFLDKLEEKDMYQIFPGNCGIAEITETGSENEESLLIIKDSFANSIVPFLLDDFSSITMVDTGYITDPVSEVIGDRKFDKVLFIFGMDDFHKEKLII